MQLKSTSFYDLLQVDARSTYSLWCDALRLLKEITEAKARQMQEDHIHELYAKAQELLDTGHLNKVEEPKMKIILSRSAAEWIILHRNTRSPIV